MGNNKISIKCSITFVNKPSFSCDLIIWQEVPSSLGDYQGFFERIKNEKILQLAAHQGTWEHLFDGAALGFFKDPKPEGWQPFLVLAKVPLNFIHLVTAGHTLYEEKGGHVWQPFTAVGWRMWV